MASSLSDCVDVNEDDVPGAELNKNLDDISKEEAVRWLKCMAARN
jgi:hypothetical protein